MGTQDQWDRTQEVWVICPNCGWNQPHELHVDRAKAWPQYGLEEVTCAKREITHWRQISGMTPETRRRHLAWVEEGRGRGCGHRFQVPVEEAKRLEQE